MATTGLSSDQPKWISGGRPTLDSSSPTAAMVCEMEAQRVTLMTMRPPSCFTSISGLW